MPCSSATRSTPTASWCTPARSRVSRSRRGSSWPARRSGSRCRSPSAARCCWRTPPVPRERSDVRSPSLPSCWTAAAAAREPLGFSSPVLPGPGRGGGGGERLGICLDSCHLLASGFEVRTRDGLTAVLDECVESVGIERLQCLHVNDSKVPLGGNADRHAPLTEGEFGEKGLSVFLSEPRFDDLPVCLETPGPSGTIGLDEVKLARSLRSKGVRARRASRRTRG